MQNTSHSLHVVLYHRGPPSCALCSRTCTTAGPLPTACTSRRASRPLHLPPRRGPYPCCMCHLAVPLSPYIPCHCAPHHRTHHHAMPLSPHAPCCCAPCGCTHHFAVPIAATHAAHLTTTTTTTVVIAPQQRDYHDHHDTPQQPLPP